MIHRRERRSNEKSDKVMRSQIALCVSLAMFFLEILLPRTKSIQCKRQSYVYKFPLSIR